MPDRARKAGVGPYRVQAGERVNAPPSSQVWESPKMATEKDCQVLGESMAQVDAREWLDSNGHSQRRHGPSRRKYQSDALSKYMRKVRNRSETKKEFVERMRSAKAAECIFVPNSVKGHVAKVVFCGKTISAARYMALMTHGTPKHEDAVARHSCGNGHLSCINPAHIEWGSEADNIADANKHRGCETVQDKIHAVSGPK